MTGTWTPRITQYYIWHFNYRMFGFHVQLKIRYFFHFQALYVYKKCIYWISDGHLYISISFISKFFESWERNCLKIYLIELKKKPHCFFKLWKKFRNGIQLFFLLFFLSNFTLFNRIMHNWAWSLNTVFTKHVKLRRLVKQKKNKSHF